MVIVASTLVVVALLGLAAYGFVIVRRIWRWTKQQAPPPSDQASFGSVPDLAPVGALGELEPKRDPGSLTSSRDSYGL
jgi:hypothetical protein